MSCLASFLLILAGLVLFGLLFGPFIGVGLGLAVSWGVLRQAWREAKEKEDQVRESDV